MEIKTKYNIGDEFWAMQGNKAYSAKVTNISIFAGESIVTIMYNNSPTFAEEYMYKTKTELLESL